MAGDGGEPSSAPHPGRWYDLKLGSSFRDINASKFYSLRYEFKPASIDNTQDGLLQKNKENRVTVEFHNNQAGKPKVTFEGSSEDYKDNDGVLFFDGEAFRLERLHRAVKRLRHVRLRGDPAVAANIASSTSAGIGVESRSPPVSKVSKTSLLSKTTLHPLPVEVEKIDIGEQRSPGPRLTNKTTDCNSAQINHFCSPPVTKSSSPGTKSYDMTSYDPDENIEIDAADINDVKAQLIVNKGAQAAEVGFDINIPNENDTDDEIADVDVSDNEVDKGPNAAEALRAQVHAEEDKQVASTSSDSASESGSSGSGSESGSSSSGSDGSDDESASSAGDIDIG